MVEPHSFSPRSVDEYALLQLVRRLGDGDLIWKYRRLLQHRPMDLIIKAFSFAQSGGLTGSDLVASFDQQLEKLANHPNEY